MADGRRATIVVDNYDYGRFLGTAIDSALAQTWPEVEVVVVDDGSTDDSRDVIARYEGRVVPVLKENGGQGSAFNAGFAVATGAVVLFLDADDTLAPDAVERAMACFVADPGLAKVQWRLAMVDDDGRPLGPLTPPAHHRMPSGDLRRALRRGGSYTWPPTTGNAFAAWALRRVLPMPEEPFRISADAYLARAVPLLGPVASLDGPPGGTYRVHDANRYWAPDALDLDRTRRVIESVCRTHRAVAEWAAANGVPEFPPEPEGYRSVAFLTLRMVSAKLDRERHPMPADTLPRLAAGGVVASLTHPTSRAHQRVLSAGWFAVMPLLPRRAAHALADKLVHPARRGPITGFFARRRRAPLFRSGGGNPPENGGFPPPERGGGGGGGGGSEHERPVAGGGPGQDGDLGQVGGQGEGDGGHRP